MEYTQNYKGRSIRIKTKEDSSGAWSSTAEVVSAENETALFETPPVSNPNEIYDSEQEAKTAALSAAASAIDRARISKGKP